MTQKQLGSQGRGDAEAEQSSNGNNSNQLRTRLCSERKGGSVCICLWWWVTLKQQRVCTITPLWWTPIKPLGGSYLIKLAVSCRRRPEAISRYGDRNFNATLHREHRVCVVRTTCGCTVMHNAVLMRTTFGVEGLQKRSGNDVAARACVRDACWLRGP
jgi:hypothetical protein